MILWEEKKTEMLSNSGQSCRWATETKVWCFMLTIVPQFSSFIRHEAQKFKDFTLKKMVKT